MGRKRRTFGAYRQPPITRQMEKAGETVKGVVGKDRYEREFTTRGILRMELYQELLQPLVSHIKRHPKLSPEQKAIGVKEVFRLFKETFDDYLDSVTLRALSYAQTYVIPVPVAPAKAGSMLGEGGWYV